MATTQHHASHAARQTADADALAPFAGQQTILLTTFRRNGAPVATPVNIVVEGDRAFIRTWDTAGKIKRIRHTPEVTIEPSTARGVPTGPELRARARILSGAEARHAARAMSRKHPLLHGLFVPLIHRMRHNRTTHIELTPIACPGCRE